MSARLSLLALPALLLLGACDGNPLQTAAGKADCCCDRCPTATAPTASVGPTKAGGATRAVASGGEARTYRVRTPPAVTGGDQYESRETSGYGGRYGARGGQVYGGVSVSVTESEAASSRYSYSESSSGYAYGSSQGGYAYGAGVSSGPGYRGAQTDHEGYLTWPGKVED